jgi:hypothetical protein
MFSEKANVVGCAFQPWPCKHMVLNVTANKLTGYSLTKSLFSNRKLREFFKIDLQSGEGEMALRTLSFFQKQEKFPFFSKQDQIEKKQIYKLSQCQIVD